jgi:hypothetical protein
VSENKCLCHGAQPTAEFAIGPINSRESAVTIDPLFSLILAHNHSVRVKLQTLSPTPEPNPSMAPKRKGTQEKTLPRLDSYPGLCLECAGISGPGRRATGERVVRAHHQPTDKPRVSKRPHELHALRSHPIAWRKDLARRRCAGSTMRRKLSAVSLLFTYLY